ncbi:polysaccharide deacetylase family protein [Rhodoferax mekongensis]|uniref:polysaccharide deacetylase family protein n=1 Tax=Rhodoferax mekongensis TaxID=3068341 RepID=UPI0028BDFE49|nr:polysaccharide deacetylase family protein [Rhodoferax sp. TBRC 17199]MDT7515479.1 polysaccharide deacetylase family protein [Rhodoferax sp. TBRC 17199]
MKIPILMYHQIELPPPRGTSLRGLIVAPASFAWQMRMLRLMGYRGLSMRDLEPYINGYKQGKVVGITFDDGYQNNILNALPTLQSNDFTATCYGVSGMIGGTNAWDAGKVAQTPLMTQQDWRTWHDAGMDVGSHTQTHANLNELPDEEARQQITQSKAELEQLLGAEVRHFCYPYGWFRAQHEEMVRAAGYVTATSTRRGRVQAGDNPYALNRIMVACSTHPLQFFMKVATAYEDKRA